MSKKVDKDFYTAIIDNYKRGTSYCFQLRPYHYKNSSTTFGPITSIDIANSTGFWAGVYKA